MATTSSRKNLPRSSTSSSLNGRRHSRARNSRSSTSLCTPLSEPTPHVHLSQKQMPPENLSMTRILDTKSMPTPRETNGLFTINLTTTSALPVSKLVLQRSSREPTSDLNDDVRGLDS